MKTDECNKRVYESNALASRYAQQESLQPPEETIIGIVREELAPARMLDIGVGGGRTTERFSLLVNEYVGVDYSENMIAACKARFREVPGALEFMVADVRSMPMFDDERFDFVLFSYNGLDYVSGETRVKALQEIRRVLRPGGYFAFSTHNLNSLERRLRLSLWGAGPKAAVSRLLWVLRFWRHNRGLGSLATSNCVEVNDGALDFLLRTHYQRPKKQIEDLRRLGFRQIRVFRLTDGQLVQSEQEMRQNSDDWLHYLCVR